MITSQARSAKPNTELSDIKQIIATISTTSLKLYSRLLRMQARGEKLNPPTLRRVNYVYERRMDQLHRCGAQLKQWSSAEINSEHQSIINNLLKQIPLIKKVNEESLLIVEKFKSSTPLAKKKTSVVAQPETKTTDSSILNSLAEIINSTLKTLDHTMQTQFSGNYAEDKNCLSTFLLGLIFSVAEKGEKTHPGLASHIFSDLAHEINQKLKMQSHDGASSHAESNPAAAPSVEICEREQAITYLRECLTADFALRFTAIPANFRDQQLMLEVLENVKTLFAAKMVK